MTSRKTAILMCLFTFSCLSAGVTKGARGQQPADAPDGLVAALAREAGRTQLNVDRALDDGRATFRASVLSFGPDRLVLLTGAHCVVGAVEGDVFRLGRGRLGWEAEVTSIKTNPSFRMESGPRPGLDAAVVRLRVKDGQNGWSEGSKTLAAAELDQNPGARPGGQVLSLLVLDQDEATHVVRAGNFRNPRWLEWGKTYLPRQGDSGSGVFVARRDGKGGARPVLVGTVSVVDADGGAGTLVWGKDPWFADALREPEPSTTTPADSPRD